MERRLAAIVIADVVGYSKLIRDDEAGTRARFQTLQKELYEPSVSAHGGQVIKTMGDAFLLEFPSAVEAVACAAEVQGKLAELEADKEQDQRIQFRIGINVGDVLVEDKDIHGDGVNVAARLEEMSEPGGILISGSVYEQVLDKLDLAYDDLGEVEVKNIARPVRAYRVRTEPSTGETTAPVGANRRSSLKAGSLVAAGLLAIVIAGLAIWQTTKPPLSSSPKALAEPEGSIATVPTGPSIAVLPFVNMSGEKEQEYFSDGLTEEIINGLTRYRDLLVIARNSSFQFKGKSVDVRQVGQDLGVSYVVQGSIRKAADIIRISVQLIDATDGRTAWAETYERKLTAANIFAVQDEIREKIVNTIGDAYGVLFKAELDKSKVKKAKNLESYDCILRGLEWASVAFTREKHLEVRTCFENALKREPDFADGWGWIAWLARIEHWFGFNPLKTDVIKRMHSAATKAVKLDPYNALGHQHLAEAYFWSGKLELFWPAAEHTLKLQPNNLGIVVELAHRMGLAGDPERSVALTRKAMALNPKHPTWYYFNFWNYHYWKKDWQIALNWAQKITMRDNFWMWACLAATYGQLNRPVEAREALEKLEKVYPGFTVKTLRKELGKANWLDWQAEIFAEGLVKAGLSDTTPTN